MANEYRQGGRGLVTIPETHRIVIGAVRRLLSVDQTRAELRMNEGADLS